MNAKEVTTLIKDHVDEIKTVNDEYLFATTDKQRYREAMLALKTQDVQHIFTITGVDQGKTVEVIYHFDCRPVLLNLKISLPKNELRIPTITDIFPGAILYERELMEMFGVKVEGHPDPRKLFLPDDWPDGEYPLRKEWRERKK